MAHLGERKEEKIKNLNSLKFNFCRNYLRVYCVPGTVLDSFCDLVFSVQLLSHLFSSVAQLCLSLCNPMGCSMSGFPIHQLRSLLKLMSIELVMPFSHLIPFSSCPQSFPASGSFPRSQLFASGDQSIGVSASTSVLAMNTQD